VLNLSKKSITRKLNESNVGPSTIWEMTGPVGRFVRQRARHPAEIMEVIAANTPKEFVLQLDVGTCEEAGEDPLAWVQANPGPRGERGGQRVSCPVR
jgi:hypothetical protein